MPYDGTATSGTLTETASFTNAYIIDTANGAPAASPAAQLQGPGLPRFAGVISIVTSAVSGTAPTFIPYLSTGQLANGSDGVEVAASENGTVSGVGEIFIPISTQQRYIGVNGTIGGTSPSFTFIARLGPSQP
jgi:hypothetical protein